MKRLVLAALVIGTVAVLSGRVPAAYVFGPVVGLLIWRIGTATFASLREGASYIPDGPPVPVDPGEERIVYWCSGCGAEVLLLVRGTDTAPRHCGERMTERAEVVRER